MDTDHLGLWIHINALIQSFDDEQLNQDSVILQFILKMFGGWKGTLLFILNDKEKFRYNQLHKLREVILESQESNNIMTNYDHSNPLHLLNMNDNLLTSIYQYLPNPDHIRLSKTCTYLFTLGRCHATFPNIQAAYHTGIVPGLSRCLINFTNHDHGMDDFIKYIKFDAADRQKYDLCPVARSGILPDLIQLSQITDNIDIRNKDKNAIEGEKRKYFVFHVMRSVVDNIFTKDRDLMIENFEFKKIAYEYCNKYRRNHPPRISNGNRDEEKQESDHLSDPYYKNAQIALYIYMMLADWEQAYGFGNDMEDIIEPLDQLHVKNRFHWQDPELIINFERLKNKELEKQIEQMEQAFVELIDSKRKLAENCVKEMNRWHRVINGLMRIPDADLRQKVEVLVNSVRIQSLRISINEFKD